MEKTVPTGGAADAWDREVSEGNCARGHAALALSGRATGLSAEGSGPRVWAEREKKERIGPVRGKRKKRRPRAGWEGGTGRAKALGC